jgi:hypothetical protein
MKYSGLESMGASIVLPKASMNFSIIKNGKIPPQNVTKTQFYKNKTVSQFLQSQRDKLHYGHFSCKNILKHIKNLEDYRIRGLKRRGGFEWATIFADIEILEGMLIYLKFRTVKKNPEETTKILVM